MFDMSPVQRRITATIFASQSLSGAAMIAAFTLTPIIAASLGSSDQLTGLPNMVMLLGRAAAGYPIGWLLDRAGRRYGLSVGLLISMVGMLISAAAIGAGSFPLFLGGAVLMGVGRSSTEQGRFIAAEVFRPTQQAKVIGLIVFAGTIGSVGGPALVSLAADFADNLGFVGYMGPFGLGAVLTGASLLWVFLGLRPDPKLLAAQIEEETMPATGAPAAQVGPSATHSAAAEAQEDVSETDEPATSATERARSSERPIWEILEAKDVQLAIAAMVIGQLVMTLLMVITPLHMSRAGHATGGISLVIMAHTLGMFGLSSVTGWLTDRVGRVPMIIAGALVQILAAVLAPLSVGLPMLALALFFLGLGWNFSFISGSSLLSNALESRERGRVQGVNEALVALASGIGSLGTGFVFAIGGGIAAVAGAVVAFSLILGALALSLGRTHLFATPAK